MRNLLVFLVLLVSTTAFAEDKPKLSPFHISDQDITALNKSVSVEELVRQRDTAQQGLAQCVAARDYFRGKLEQAASEIDALNDDKAKAATPKP